MKENAHFILDIKRLGINGEGIGFYNRLAVFVADAIPGEGHDVVVEKINGNMAYAKSVGIKTPSSARVNPSCPHYYECGKCNVSHIAYNQSQKFKRDLIIEALNRYSKINYKAFEIKEPITLNDGFNYRKYVDVLVKKEKGEYRGFLKASKPIPLADCLITKSSIKQICEDVLIKALEVDIPEYIPKFRRGVLKCLKIGVNNLDEALVILVCNEKNSKLKALAELLLKNTQIKSIYEEFADGTINHLAGSVYLEEKINDTIFRLYPNSYFINNIHKIEVVLKACKLAKKERVLSNSLELGLGIAKFTKELVLVEYDKDLVVKMNDNLSFNKLNNTKVLQGDIDLLANKLYKDNSFDVVVFDAKKYNLSSALIDATLNFLPKRIVYTSFNPSALARDLDKLSKKYQIKYIALVDSEPQTALLESVVLLELKKI